MSEPEPKGSPAPRERCANEEAITEIFKNRVESALTFDSSSSIESDRKAFQTLAKANQALLRDLHQEHGNMSFGKLFLKAILRNTAQHNREKWGFTDQDVAKFANDTIENVHSLMCKMGKELRQPSRAKWVKDLLGLADTPKKETGDYLVGWVRETRSAWRVKDCDSEKEYTNTFEMPDKPDDLDSMIAVWKTPAGIWKHSISGLTVLQWKEMQKNASERWSYRTDDGNVKIGKNATHFRTLLLTTPEMKERQVCQIRIQAGDDETFVQNLGRDFLDGKIEGTSMKEDKLTETRVALRNERDRRLNNKPEEPEAPAAKTPKAAMKRPAASSEPGTASEKRPTKKSQKAREPKAGPEEATLGLVEDEDEGVPIKDFVDSGEEEEEGAGDVILPPDEMSWDTWLLQSSIFLEV